jgi:hypothetical protein
MTDSHINRGILRGAGHPRVSIFRSDSLSTIDLGALEALELAEELIEEARHILGGPSVAELDAAWDAEDEDEEQEEALP